MGILRLPRPTVFAGALLGAALLFSQSKPAATTKAVPGGYDLPNGWRLTPLGTHVPTEDMVLNISPAPGGKSSVALHAGFNPHGLVVIDNKTHEAVQRIPLKSAWLGMAWSPDGRKLYVSGGNAESRRNASRAPVNVFDFDGARLSPQPSATLDESIDLGKVYWSGLAHHPTKPILFAANRGTGPQPGHIVLFDTESKKLITRIQVEVNPYDVVLTPDGSTLYTSNWGSDSVSVIDTASRKVIATIAVGDNPNDLELHPDGRLFVSSSQDNSVTVIDTKARRAVETINTAMFPRAPEGSTPNALAIDAARNLLFVANADNNNVAVVRIKDAGRGEVIGFLPTGWYPSSLALIDGGKRLLVGNSKGGGGYANPRGPHSPLPPDGEGAGSVKSLQKGTVSSIDIADLETQLPKWTKQVYDNCPYADKLLAQARESEVPTIIPRDVGAGSPIKHVIYIIKENRTYDQVLGDLLRGNGDSRITIFGRKITPNQHALAEEFVLLDNLFCDGEVSVDGHSWSTSAYATDFNEKLWPVTYGGHSKAAPSNAYVPAGGHLWDLAKKKGLTYRSYGEYATRSSDGTTMEASPGVGNLYGHVAPKYKMPGMRDTDNAREFIKEFDEYERNFDNADPNKRLPNLIVMSMPENHTAGTTPGRPTPRAMVANGDYALGLLVERVTHSKYWPETAIFVIEDDAQDGSDHVDARRTIGFVVSPYTRRKSLDSTLYTTSSMLRTIELLLGLPPMSQYDAAANPMYKALGTEQDLASFTHRKPEWDVNEMNTLRAWGAKKSLEMDFSDVDRTDMFALNEIIWKSVKGAKSEMPLPVHRFNFGR